MSAHSEHGGLEARCVDTGHWQVEGYDLVHLPHPRVVLGSAWVVWRFGVPVAVRPTFQQARSWVAVELHGGGSR
ncbi:hypothetical protein Kfla_5565 [Kribbella flavida DSM 17836]|uniref:Uncharacterized protein n=1 Tax=Kribbella flavida (strain DSM 17836 / JCM 10339 / NBRC 14399) TaxID=479435 RepID=D2PN87_KRIFD|nr:hypothetical protein [Kribbella flavida]ADB34571.1 hypothetical protein Kfla_5565 [Kribbella flavida DSM 17836]